MTEALILFTAVWVVTSTGVWALAPPDPLRTPTEEIVGSVVIGLGLSAVLCAVAAIVALTVVVVVG